MKMKGFTILELVIVALITTVVMALGYNGYLMIKKISSRKMALQEEMASIYKLNQLIQNEVYHSDTILWDKRNSTIMFSQSKLNLIDQPVVTRHNSIDSFKVNLIDLQIEEIDCDDIRVVNNVRLTVLLDSEEVTLSARKEYSPYFIEGFKK